MYTYIHIYMYTHTCMYSYGCMGIYTCMWYIIYIHHTLLRPPDASISTQLTQFHVHIMSQISCQLAPIDWYNIGHPEAQDLTPSTPLSTNYRHETSYKRWAHTHVYSHTKSRATHTCHQYHTRSETQLTPFFSNTPSKMTSLPPDSSLRANFRVERVVCLLVITTRSHFFNVLENGIVYWPRWIWSYSFRQSSSEINSRQVWSSYCQRTQNNCNSRQRCDVCASTQIDSRWFFLPRLMFNRRYLISNTAHPQPYMYLFVYTYFPLHTCVCVCVYTILYTSVLGPSTPLSIATTLASLPTTTYDE